MKHFFFDTNASVAKGCRSGQKINDDAIHKGSLTQRPTPR